MTAEQSRALNDVYAAISRLKEARAILMHVPGNADWCKDAKFCVANAEGSYRTIAQHFRDR